MKSDDNYFNINDISSLVDFHVGRQVNHTSLSEVTSKEVSCTTSVTFWIDHLFKLGLNYKEEIKIYKKLFNQ
jgi:hypothetical protein